MPRSVRPRGPLRHRARQPLRPRPSRCERLTLPRPQPVASSSPGRCVPAGRPSRPGAPTIVVTHWRAAHRRNAGPGDSSPVVAVISTTALRNPAPHVRRGVANEGFGRAQLEVVPLVVHGLVVHGDLGHRVLVGGMNGRLLPQYRRGHQLDPLREQELVSVLAPCGSSEQLVEPLGREPALQCRAHHHAERAAFTNGSKLGGRIPTPLPARDVTTDSVIPQRQPASPWKPWP
ncbi:hypothetical protein VT84_11175 [Gemmata sp. SH-PL17]|nr:hypothetical protein VT84_11175 [Gemmata sp. SH-PL17]